MSNLPAVSSPGFPAVYELAVTDPVLGGPDGVDNLPHRQLAERTEYLKDQDEKLDAALALLRGEVDGLQIESGTAVRSALLLSWLYGEDSPSFELFAPGFTWRDVAPIAVAQAVAGDDTIDLATTEGLRADRTYVITDAAGLQIETLDLAVVLTGTRIRSKLNLTHSLTAQSGAFLARTGAEVRDGYAIFQPGDAYYSRVLTELRTQPNGQLVLRRSAEGTGTFRVSYRVAGSQVWALAVLSDVVARAAGTRDETYIVGVGGSIELRITYSSATGASERVDHLVLLPPARVETTGAVARPTNVAPADQAANVGQTPTLTGSAFRSLYGLAQGGAHFQVARDPAMSDIVVNTATDFLASWVAVSGQSSPFTDVLALGAKTFLAVANGVSIRTTDGGLNYATGTVSGDLKRVAGTSALVAAVGASGAIRTSTDGGLTFTVRTAAASYAGVFSGVTVRDAFIVAVGDGGQIQRSINGGAIFNQVQADAAYAGTFTDLASDGTGKLIAVGSNGEIQTSANDGQTWSHRNAPNGYAGAYQAVAMDGAGNAVAVGANGAIHTSADYGATWTARAADAAYSGTFYGVAIRGQLVVAVGANGEIQTSKDLGATWTHRAAGGSATATIRAVALDPDAYGLALGDGGLVQRTLKLDTATTTFTVPSGPDFLQVNKVYWWRVRYSDVTGAFSPWSATTAFATQATFAYVAAPRNLSPASGDASVSLLPTMQTSAFAYVGPVDTHARSQFQIASTTAFSTLAYDSGESTDLLTHTMASGTPLVAEGTYFWRARHKGVNNGFGAWSEPTSFKVQARPNKPSIIAPADGATQVALAPTITTSAFSQAGGGTHARSQYQVSALSSFASLFHDSGDVTALTAYTLPAGTLAFDTPYFARARHKDTNGAYSAWSSVVGFRTTNAASVAQTFGLLLYNGNAAARSLVNGIDLAGNGGMVDFKNVNGAAANGHHIRYSTVRGVGKRLSIDDPAAEQTGVAGVTSFNANGFSLGNASETNSPDGKFLAMTWRRSPRFYDTFVVQGTGGNRALPHILGVAPGCVRVRRIDQGGALQSYHRGATAPNADWWRNWLPVSESYKTYGAVNFGSLTGLIQAPDAANIYVGSEYNNPDGIYEFEVFAHDPAPEGTILCGSFTVNSSLVGVFDTGWSGGAQWIETRCATAGSPWWNMDTLRAPGFSGNDRTLDPSTATSEGSGSGVDVVSQSNGVLTFSNPNLVANSTYIIRAVRAAGA